MDEQRSKLNHRYCVAARADVSVGDAAPPLWRLGTDTVHVWCADSRNLAASLDRWEPLLSQDEAERASRYRFRKDRDRFIVARGLLRMLLSRYVGMAPECIRIIYNAYGKPAVAQASEQGLEFSVSHTEDAVLYAFTHGKRLGIDVERLRENIDAIGIAERLFTCEELNLLKAANENSRSQLFFRFWTRKEACVKALGLGLYYPLDRVDVRWRTCAIAPSRGERLVLSLTTFRPWDGYAASLAVEGDVRSVAWLRFDADEWARSGISRRCDA